MTHDQKLNYILNVLLSRLPKRLENGVDDKRLTFEFLCNALFKDENMPNWEVMFLRNTLQNDGYMEFLSYDGVELPIITHNGIKFIQNGGYEKEKENKKAQEELINTTIKNNKRSLWALVISVISLGITIFSIFIK